MATEDRAKAADNDTELVTPLRCSVVSQSCGDHAAMIASLKRKKDTNNKIIKISIEIKRM